MKYTLAYKHLDGSLIEETGLALSEAVEVALGQIFPEDEFKATEQIDGIEVAFTDTAEGTVKPVDLPKDIVELNNHFKYLIAFHDTDLKFVIIERTN